MPYSLIHERWLPVRRESGAAERIAPWQITDRYAADPVVALAPPRPDLAGGLTEFLIGLLQTACAPSDDDAWFDWWEQPPPPERLREAMVAVEHAFLIDGDGPRFMQDFDELDGEAVPIGQLLIDSPGANALRRNTDLFVKRGGIRALCRACVAAALHILQTYAPQGGAGHRTSLRGGGPLTTLIVVDRLEGAGPTLWTCLWPNVLTHRQIDTLRVERRETDHASIFPWLARTRVSEKGGGPTFPVDADPLQMYWGMPRRIRLDFADGDGESCGLCGALDERVVRSFRTRPRGVNYEGAWRHPLSPYVEQKTGPALPRHAGPGGISYRHWLGLVQEPRDGKDGRRPAQVVTLFRTTRAPYLSEAKHRLVAFGYDMDTMKPRCWYESEMPLLRLPEDGDLRERFEAGTEQLVRAADEAARAATWAVKRALFDNPADAAGDFGVIGERFWRDTEAAFHRTLDVLLEALNRDLDDHDSDLPARQAWHKALARAAFAIFDDLVEVETQGAVDFARAVKARRGLASALHSGKMHRILALPKPARRAAGPSQQQEANL